MNEPAFRRRSPLRALRSFAARVLRGFEALVLLSAFPRDRSGGVVVIRVDVIGDFVLWLDAAKELKLLYPGRKITLLANSLWAEVAEKLPYWDEVWAVNHTQLSRYSFYRWKLLRAVRKRGFDVAIQPTFLREFRAGDALIRATGARERIGSTGDFRNMDPRQKSVADRWYTRLLPASQNPMMELERNAEFMRSLGRENFAAASPVLPKLAESPKRLRIATSYFILFPGASWSGRQWPPARFAEVADSLSRSMGWKGVVSGTAAEADLCRQVVESAEVEVINLAGQTSLLEFVELARGASLLIGNETSAVHIATAVGTPTVCILGGGHYGRFVPYETAMAADPRPEPAVHRMPCFGCNWHCTQPHEEGGPVPCIGGVSVADVLRACERAMAAHSNQLLEMGKRPSKVAN